MRQMKLPLFTIIAIIAVQAAQSQTLKETQDWLKQKIESYGTSSSSETSWEKTNKIDVFDFSNNEIVIEETENIIATSGNIACTIKRKWYGRVAFDKIISIEVLAKGIDIKTNGNRISIQTKFLIKKCSSEQANTIIDAIQDGSSKTSSYYIGIDFSKEDNLPGRFRKAINRLLTFIPKQKKEVF